MNLPVMTPSQVRSRLLLGEEIALLDLRHEAAYATGHPLFAANMAAGRIAIEAAARLPRKDVPIVVYDAGEGLLAEAAGQFAALGYTDIRELEGGLEGWRRAGFEIFIDVNSYAKAFGELVESRRHTPSLSAEEVARLLSSKADVRILDVRRPDEYTTMNIPGSVSVPGAELVLRAGHVAPDSKTTIVVNCAGRTRSIIGAQSLINAGIANKVVALRNGTMGWTLANQTLEHGADRRGGIGRFEGAKDKAREVAYRAGVRHFDSREAAVLDADRTRTLYRFDVRPVEDYAAGHIEGFRHYPGGQLVQEIDMAAPVRGARILSDRRQGSSRRHDRVMARADGLGSLTCSRAVMIARSKSGRRRFCPSRIRRTAIGVLTKAPMHQERRCRLISTGNMALSNSSGATAPTASS